MLTANCHCISGQKKSDACNILAYRIRFAWENAKTNMWVL